MSQVHCIITGRVQMVMYRDFAQRKARKLGVCGTVQNRGDGSVEVVAVAEKKTLEKYIEYLKKGSIFSHVEHVVVEWGTPVKDFTDFQIIY